MATTQEAVQISAIVPTLTVDDLQKSITFYEALGFAIDDRWEEKGTLLGVMLLAGRPRSCLRTIHEGSDPDGTSSDAALRDRPSPDADVHDISTSGPSIGAVRPAASTKSDPSRHGTD